MALALGICNMSDGNLGDESSSKFLVELHVFFQTQQEHHLIYE